jgi:hypothetical protein
MARKTAGPALEFQPAAAMYDLYKPFRNRLRALSLMPSLMGVYRYAQFVQFDKPLPDPLKYPNFGWTTPRQTGLHEWTLELIARELILNAPEVGPRAMTTWNEFAALANLVRDIEDQTWGRLPNGPALIEYEMVRTSHRQFPWQVRPNSRLIASYFKLYSNDRLAGLMAETYGMSAVEFYQVGLGLIGHFLEHPILRTPVTNQMNAVPQDTIGRLVDRVSLSMAELRERIRQMQAYNINWAYAFDPLRTWPLIDIGENQLFCPMPTLLMWRLTEGVYFDLVQHRQEFDRNFGLAFQDLIAEVVRAADPGGRLQVFPEERYGTRQRPRDSVDWILQDDTASIFLECKASRLKAQAKVDINDTATIDGEVNRLADFVVQVYITLTDAMQGAYHRWKPNDLPVYPLVVTLDEWLPSGRSLMGGLEAAVRAGVQRRGIPLSILGESPFTLCSLYEFESAARAFGAASIQAVMGGKTTGEHHGWAMLPFLQDQFSRMVGGGAVLFEDEWRGVFRGLINRA